MFIISLRGSNYDYSPQTSKTATPLLQWTMLVEVALWNKPPNSHTSPRVMVKHTSVSWRLIGVSWGMAQVMLNFGTTWRPVDIFMPWPPPPPHPQAGSQIHIEYDGWARGPIWKFWRREKSCVPVTIWILDCPVYSLVTVLTTLPQFTTYTYISSIWNTYVQMCNIHTEKR